MGEYEQQSQGSKVSSTSSISNIIDSSSTCKKYRRNSKEENSDKEASADERLIKECSQSVGNHKHLITLYKDNPDELMEFLRYAVKNVKNKLYHYVNKSTSWANWEKTLSDWKKNLQKLRQMVEVAPYVIKKLGLTTSKQCDVVRAICYKQGQSVLWYAERSAATGRDKFKLFCWFTSASGKAKMAENNLPLSSAS